MNLEILTNPTDDSHFVELLKHLISRLVSEKFPEQIFVIKIDNWFDHKWLNFIDMRSPSVGFGFSWGRYDFNTVVKRYGQLPIFAYKKKKGIL
jgi:hypothetical protein